MALVFVFKWYSLFQYPIAIGLNSTSLEMYIDSQFKQFKMFWPPITKHTYERVSRSKWRILLNYKCGAKAVLENQPDDFIQCLVLGAFNSYIDISTNLGNIPAEMERPSPPITTWKEIQPLILN